METVSPNWALLHRAGRFGASIFLDISKKAPAAQLADAKPDEGVVATDRKLVGQALAGSEAAFRELVRRYERSVFGLIARLTRNPSRAEELAQDTFVKAFQHLHTYDLDRKFGTWLLAIAHHAAVDEMRRTRTEPELFENGLSNPDEISDTGAEMPDAVAERAELARILDAAIQRLRPEYAELVALRYEQELTLDEIAAVTGLPIGTIKSYLHRARKELAGFISSAGWKP